MRNKLKWLALPPALALVLMLGPWSGVQGSETTTPQNGGAPPATTTEPASGLRPQLPDLGRALATTVGVCLLGVAIVMVLARLRGRGLARTGGGDAAAPRLQLARTLRVSRRSAVHAVVWGDRALLVGEGDGGLVLLDGSQRAAPPAARDDEEDDDDGVVLKDMVLPRPDRAAARRPAAAPSPGFRALLAKAHAGS